jgi:hypothetical protein
METYKLAYRMANGGMEEWMDKLMFLEVILMEKK